MATSLLPSGPRAYLPFGADTAVRFARDPLPFLTHLATYGDIAAVRVGGYAIYLLNRPDYIQDVLVTHQRQFDKGQTLAVIKTLVGEGLLTSEGDFHLRQRRLAQPAFHRHRINAYADTMTTVTQRQITTWQAGSVIDIGAEMMHMTLAIVARTLLDADVDGADTHLRDALTALYGWSTRALLPAPLARTLDSLPLASNRRFRAARAFLDATIYRMIAERRASTGDGTDLLSLLIRASSADAAEQMTDRQVRDEALTVFLAGYETTAVALTWLWYVLSQNPDVEERLHAELDTVLAGRPPTLADVPRLVYTERVFAETLRLYPPAYLTSRRVAAPVTIGGYSLPVDSGLLLSPYLMHRHPQFWPDPERFDPERWTPDAKAGRPKFAYFPFGGGTRVCIGEPFAWLEGVLVIATIAQQWRLRMRPGQTIAYAALGTLRPKNGIQMCVEKRPSA